MEFNYEKVWRDITDIQVTGVSKMLKEYIRYRRDSGICFVIAELDFITDGTLKNKIEVKVPQINDSFTPCENTIFATKIEDGEEIDTLIRLKLSPGKFELYAYPFSPNTKYELNMQLFMCLTDGKFFMPLTK